MANGQRVRSLHAPKVVGQEAPYREHIRKGCGAEARGAYLIGMSDNLMVDTCYLPLLWVVPNRGFQASSRLVVGQVVMCFARPLVYRNHALVGALS